MNPFDLRLYMRFAALQRKESDLRAHTINTSEQLSHSIHLAKIFSSAPDLIPDHARSESNSLHKEGEMLRKLNPILEPSHAPRIACGQSLQSLRANSPVHRGGSIAAQLVHKERMPGEISHLNIQAFCNMICVAGNSFLRIFDRKEGGCVVDWVATVPGSRNRVHSIAGIDDQIVAFGSEDGFIRFYDLRCSAIVEEFPAHRAPVIHLTPFHIGRAVLLSSSADGEICLWDSKTFELVRRGGLEGEIVRGCQKQDDRSLYIVTESDKVFSWEYETADLQLAPELQSHSKYETADFSIEIRERAVVAWGRARLSYTLELTMNGEVIVQACCGDRCVAMASGDVVVLWEVGKSTDFPDG
jgi:WD40 repeat protein